jgi:lantibiotic biosynthesis protein
MKRKSPINPVRISYSVKQKALSISRDIAEKLTDPIRIKQIATSSENVSVTGALPWGDTSLSHGYPGAILLLANWDRREPDKGWDLHAHQHMMQVKSHLEQNGINNVSMFAGLSGVAFACQAASREGERYTQFLNVVNDVIAKEVNQFINSDKQRARNEKGTNPKVYDVITGLSGIGGYLLTNADNSLLNHTLELILKYLVDLTREIEVNGYWVPGWYVPRKYQFLEKDKALYSQGNFNCGLAHGIPGPLALLSLATLRNVKVKNQLEAIQLMSEWLSERMMEDEYGPLWPDRIRFEDEIHNRRPDHYFTREAWCYGTPGVARSLYLAGKALNDCALKELAMRSFQATISRPKELWKAESSSFCHGKSGVLQIFLRMAEDTGEAMFFESIESLALSIFDQYETDLPFGYQDIEGPNRLNKVGLLEGASGIGLVLMSLETMESIHWDTPFLIG